MHINGLGTFTRYINISTLLYEKMNSVIRIHLEGDVQVLVSESVMNVVQEIRSRFQANPIHISTGSLLFPSGQYTRQATQGFILKAIDVNTSE